MDNFSDIEKSMSLKFWPSIAQIAEIVKDIRTRKISSFNEYVNRKVKLDDFLMSVVPVIFDGLSMNYSLKAIQFMFVVVTADSLYLTKLLTDGRLEGELNAVIDAELKERYTAKRLGSEEVEFYETWYLNR